MRLDRVYVRFYKSFNYDFERRAKTGASRRDWELTDEGWFPYVRLDLEPDITAIVGANEAGKTHLLDAIRALLTGRGIERQDFCRYSTLYSVTDGQMRLPDFGGRFVVQLGDEELLGSLGFPSTAERLWFFRPGGTGQEPFVLDAEDGPARVLDAAQLAAVEAALPVPFDIDTGTGLPDAVDLKPLAGIASRVPGRAVRDELLSALDAGRAGPTELTALVPRLLEILSTPRPAETKAQALGRKLLRDISGIGEQAFADLVDAMKKGREGEVAALLQRMNESIATHLNPQRWWSQDRDFELRLGPREHELVLTIRDRTGTDYSFSERSRGLQFFLGYLVELQAHQPGPRQEILLMDEPDAYLSNAGQQDLLRVLEHYARPDDGSRHDQVVYVTHSPFLINRNAGDRLRVLDKGRSEEGTRVVRDASQNTYEPLRSSLGSYVAETAFIGGSNLFVEGMADQVLLAGMSRHLRGVGAPPSELLDLNEVTVVVGGGASSLPYLLYLARGRDEIKPPCVVLLDGDPAGDEAVKKIRRGEANGKPLLDQRYVLRVPDLDGLGGLQAAEGVAVAELEDLLPPAVAAAAARAYAAKFLGLAADGVAVLTADVVAAAVAAAPGSLWDALDGAFADTFGATLDKVGFAREVVALAPFLGPGIADGDRAALEGNFRLVLADVAAALATATSAEQESQRRRRLKRIVGRFVDTYRSGVTRDKANVALREIESVLGDTHEDDIVRNHVSDMRRDHDLSSDPLGPVVRHQDLLDAFAALPEQVRLHHQEAAGQSSGDAVAATAPTRHGRSPARRRTASQA